MAKKSASFEQEPAVRKSFLIVGGVALAAAVLGFVVMNFVLGGGGGDEDTGGEDTASQVSTTNAPEAPAVEPPATPKPAEPKGLTSGGYDPFRKLSAPAGGADTTVQAAAVTNPEIEIALLKVYGSSVDLKVGDHVLEGVQQRAVLSPDINLDEIDGECLFLKAYGKRTKVCEGDSVKV
jgi:hypothetical protein